MGEPYQMGVAVAGTRACVVMSREGRTRIVGPWETGASDPHAAAIAAVTRAAQHPLATAEPRRIYLRQNPVVQAFAKYDDLALVLLESRTSLVWRSFRAPEGEHLLVIQAAALLNPCATTTPAGAP